MRVPWVVSRTLRVVLGRVELRWGDLGPAGRLHDEQNPLGSTLDDQDPFGSSQDSFGSSEDSSWVASGRVGPTWGDLGLASAGLLHDE